jgi:ABC-type glycerol-3-phosphate transport system permease component
MILSRRGRAIRRTVMTGGLGIFLVWTLVPFLWIIDTSLKPTAELYQGATALPRSPTLANYAALFTDSDFLTYFKNSLVVAVSTTVIAMAIGVLAAYAMTRLSFKGKGLLGNVTIVTYLVPPALLFIPLFQVAYEFHLTDMAVGLIPVYLIFSVPFCTWLAISYFSTIPFELEEAAFVDGANRLQALWRVLLPMTLPALAVTALYAFSQAWNEFLFALILISSDSEKTVPLGLVEFIIGDVYQWGPLMAGAVLASLPPILIYVLAQRWIVSGLAAGAVKG